ncbi:hypothetical protein F5I97DRAFT_1916466 [Phlebopus sp. FC_14]|nr:hypothetical protein F5I97DRAFT_1916466 [Phlebopus sp. FC_14]
MTLQTITLGAVPCALFANAIYERAASSLSAQYGYLCLVLWLSGRTQACFTSCSSPSVVMRRPDMPDRAVQWRARENVAVHGTEPRI